METRRSDLMRSPKKPRTFFIATLLNTLCACVALVDVANAGTGTKITLPSANNSKLVNGIIAEVDSRWAEGFGYRPVKVTLSTRRSKRERVVRIALLPESQTSWDEPLRFEGDVVIPQGEKEASKTFYVPQQMPWNSFRVEFFEENRKLKDISMKHSTYWSNNTYNVDSPCVLLVDADAPALDDRDRKQTGLTKAFELPDARKLEFIATQFSPRSAARRSVIDEDGNEIEEVDEERISDLETLRLLEDLGNLELIPPSDLPVEYIGLTGIDLLVISLDELTKLSETDAARFRAIDQFVRNGGNLAVFAAQNVTAQTSQLFRRELEWTSANKQRYPTSARATFHGMNYGNGNVDKTRIKIPANLPVVETASHGFGILAAIASDDPYEPPAQFWQWVMTSIGVDRLTWGERHGVSMVGENDDYWDFMIPGFGASPVKAFLGVITLFILCIGPLNYWLLKRSKRLYLLPVTVGLAALLTTVTMLTYALISDGLITRVRQRSVTLLDQHEDEHIAATHCRQSYLASITPSRGLVFPQHCCVYPVMAYSDNSERKEVVNDRANERVLSRGYMRPRSTMQFLTTNVAPTSAGIKIKTSDDNTIQGAVNEISVALSHAWMRDANGKLFQASDVANGALLNLQPVDDEAARLLFVKLYNEHKPKPPEGLDKNSSPMMGNMNRNRYRYYGSAGPTRTSSSLLHKYIYRPTNKLPNFFTQPTPNTYVVVTSEAPTFVHSGTKARQMVGFHVVMGSW